MNPDPRAQAAFDAAMNHIKTTTSSVADRVADHLGSLASAANRILERDALMGAQLDLRRNMSTFVLVFADNLSKKVTKELRPGIDGSRKLADTDWHSLSLVEDDAVEEQMFANRVAQVIAHECEWELREVASYTGQLLGIGRAEHERNPLRPEILGEAIYRAIVSVSKERENRKLMAREIGSAMARVMPTCYAEIVRDFRARGVQPVGLTVRGVEGPGNELAKDRVVSGYDTLRDASSPTSGHGDTGAHSGYAGDAPTQPLGSVPQGQAGGNSVSSGRGGGGGGGGGHGGPAGGRATNPGSWNGGGSGAPPGSATQRAANRGGPGHGVASSGRGGSPADAEMMALIRRLTFLATRPADIGSPISGNSGRGSLDAGASGGPLSDFASGLMAVNLIRAHRDELRQATSGQLDHMVIDVVGSLFDQILSDPRVPPQMARQIARLQLPVLRVALVDNSFFSSRKHPVRRFVNRIASLACAFDDFTEDPGKQFLAHVRELVQEIVEGDFDQMDLFTSKLNALESYVAQQAKDDLEANASAVSVVDNKESELRVQQRYMLQLRAALQPVSMQEYLRDFITQVWSQAIALASRREGPQADLTQRLKRAGRELVMSVQPKGSPALRKKFLMQLPPLMKDLNEGMQLIGWPEAAQKEFFSRLLPAHAESLKAHPLSELDYNLLAKELEGVFNTPVPEPDALLRDVPMTSTGTVDPEPQFSDTEAQQIGLIAESEVDWSHTVDVDLSGAEPEPEPVDSAPDTQPMDLNLDLAASLDLDLSAKEAPEPTHGLQLMDHVKVGFVYQMHLNDQWQKVRLSYVSPGRAFFVFTRGRKHHETVSLTARMLARMCDSNRFKAFESNYLIERATARARKQLAALSAPAAKPIPRLKQ